jgi:ABC-type antimicrobial peptide transport system permease subunit
VAALFTGFSVLALALAAVGLFSVVSYSVAQRTNEFGIRMALGASKWNVLGLVFASTTGNLIGGVACGLVLSAALGKVLSRWAENSVQNPLVMIGVTLLLLITSAIAAFIPARRASSVDPMIALRYE